MSKMLAETIALTAEPTIEAGGEEMDVFTEAHALQNCMKFLMASARDRGLDETVAALEDVILAVDRDLRRFCN